MLHDALTWQKRKENETSEKKKKKEKEGRETLLSVTDDKNRMKISLINSTSYL